MIFEGYAAVLYGIGLVLVSLYLLMSVDDFLWDIITSVMRRFRRKQDLDFKKLDTVPPKLLAVTIAAWHEENVLGDVIDNFIESTSYPRSMYHIFLGIYPNDPPTLEVALDLAKRHHNVHVIINTLPGPTSKAQNINHVIRQIRLFEQEHEWEFASLTIHDSEDVVHPYELLVTNYLLDTPRCAAVPGVSAAAPAADVQFLPEYYNRHICRRVCRKPLHDHGQPFPCQGIRPLRRNRICAVTKNAFVFRRQGRAAKRQPDGRLPPGADAV